MADEITFGYKTGETLGYSVHNPDGTEVTALVGGNLSEVGATGYYHADNGDIAAGDIVIVNDGTQNVGWGQYMPEVSSSSGTANLETYIDTNVIGADGDTLEDLSDQMDTVGQTATTVFNVYGPGE